MAIINAASLSRDDVNTAVQSASAGDTVVLPSGTANWTDRINWIAPANVTLKGAGTSVTGGGDQTTVIDDYASGSPLIDITIPNTGTFRITGITIQGGTGSIKDGGTILLTGQSTGTSNLRIDHCHFNANSNNNYKFIKFSTGIVGVMHECVIDLAGARALYFYNGRQNGAGNPGNYEWTQPTEFGSANYFFIEDCVVNGADKQVRLYDGNDAAKVVVRFNTLVNSCLVEDHGTGHSNDDRGPRSKEIYGNLVTSTIVGVEPNEVGIGNHAGTALIWGNSFDQVFKKVYGFQVIRKDNGTYTMAATPDGWGYAGTAFNGVGSDWDGGTFNGTDLVTGYPCIDQPGRGQGDLITGSFPSKVNDSTGTIRWPNQLLEPIYTWSNNGTYVSGWGGSSQYANMAGDRMAPDRDYYEQASGIQTNVTTPFDGTTGVGWGTIANRPTTCTTGVAYWAIDVGTWNQSASNPEGVQQNGASGVLYVATATDTWTEYYEPYTYPHPLRLGAFTEDPVFSPVGGEYEGNQVVEITTDTDGATIRYTLDGSTPSSSHGTVYSTAIGVAEDLTIKAIAYKEGLTDSSVVEAIYVITEPGGGGGGVSAGGLTANSITLGG